MALSEMRIAVRPNKLVSFSKPRASFYMKYASAVFKTLRKPLFQSFLRWVLKREDIEEHMVANVQVMVFPLQKENGKYIAGRCNSEGEIYIYPKRLDFCRKLRKRWGKEEFHFYIRNRARAALIHELLHVKYSSDEEQVRKLTRRYFKIFNRHRNTPNPNKHKVLKMLFKQ